MISLIKLAWRNCWRSIGRTLVVVCSIIVGVWASLLLMGFMDGLMASRQSTGVDRYYSHLQIETDSYEYDQSLTNYIPEIETYFGSKIEFSEIGLSGGAHLKNLENSGYITKGDSTGNPHPDQLTHRDINNDPVQPVDPDWVVGMARGELPWFGLIKLKITQPENYDNAPSGCKSMLLISIIIILVGPYTVGKLLEVREQRIQSAAKRKNKP